jgi:SAM-dependent methyltransferase
MSHSPSLNAFRPPRDWETLYAADPQAFVFGEEPSQIARTALSFFRTFGGDPAQAVALDLGCGEGRDTAALAEAGFHVVAVDVAPAGLAKLTALLQRRGVSDEHVETHLEDVRRFSYPDAAYDLALAANVFQFLPPDEAPEHIRRLQSATKPGGICAVGVFSSVLLEWGAQLEGLFSATPAELQGYFPAQENWQLLDRTEYWTYRPQDDTMAAFTYVVARKQFP